MKTAQSYMTKSPISVGRRCLLTVAQQLMKEKHIRHLPVLSEDGSLIGILSDRDIKKALNNPNPYSQMNGLGANLVTEDFMSWPAHVVPESTPLSSVAKAMLTKKISAILVEDSSKKLSGIITTDDLLKFIVDSDTCPIDQ